MATTLTPAQQQALQGFVDYVKTKTSTPASTSQTQGVASLASTPATTSQTQGVASLNTQPWWVGQFASEADANYVDTNRNQKIEDTEKATWRSQYDPKSTEYKLRSSTDTYIDPVENKDYTEGLRAYLAKQLTDRGITDFGQVEKKVIPAQQARTAGSGFLSNQALNQFIASRFDEDYTERTKYYNKETGKEIDPVLFDDKAGTKYIVTSNGIQKQFDPYAKVAAQASQYISPSSSGGAWGHFGTQGMVNQIGRRVRDLTGVDDINDLELVTKDIPVNVLVMPMYNEDGVPRYGKLVNGYQQELTPEELKNVKTVNAYDSDTGSYFEQRTVDTTIKQQGVYNKKTGKLVAQADENNLVPTIDLGGWGEGPGITYASMTFDANGKPKISTYGEDTNTLSQIQPLMTLASIIPSPIQPFAIAANAANAAYNYGNFAPAILAAAGYSGILDSIAGTASNVAGPAGELASNSGIAGLAQDLGVSANLANSIGRVGAQGALSGTISAAQGKGFDTGFTSGITSGLVKEGVNELSAATGLDKGLGSLAGPTKSLVSSALTSAALDRPFDFSEAAKTAAMRYGVGEISKLTGLTPEQGKAVNSFLEYLGKKK